MKNPTDYRYAKTHEWVRKDDEKTAVIGITAFAIKELRDLVFLELPEEGDEIEKGEVFGEVESVKAVSDLYAPVTGTVVRVNDGLEDDLDTLVENPYTDGWLIAVEMANPGEWNDLMEAVAYEKHIEEEE